MCVVFQAKVSTRENSEGSGGTGLPRFLNSISEHAQEKFCYVHSGNNMLLFNKDHIIDKGYGYGFNSKNNFISNIPDEENLVNCNLYFPGTIYSLLLGFDNWKEIIYG